MSNPWDVPPKPTSSTDSSETLYASVGQALSNWELVEQELGQIFAIFVGWPVFGNPLEEPALRAYGSVVSFNGRADMLEAASKAFFSQKPNPHIELKFRGLMAQTKGFSGRRNDIAHGRVECILKNEHPWWTSDETFSNLLLPGLYASKKYTRDCEPMYVYTSKEILYFAYSFKFLSEKLHELSMDIFQVYASP
jgi:hypothetical protein